MKQLFHLDDYLAIFIQIIKNTALVTNLWNIVYIIYQEITSESFHTQLLYFSYFLLS